MSVLRVAPLAVLFCALLLVFCGTVLNFLPRSSPGPQVRRDVLMARAWREGDFATAGELCAGKSERHIVAEQLQAVSVMNEQNRVAKIGVVY